MGLGQTMLSIMFLVLLTVAVINGNRLIIDKAESYYKNQAYQEASILANNLLSEITSKKFDDNTLQAAEPFLTDTGWVAGKTNDSTSFSSDMNVENSGEWNNVTEHGDYPLLLDAKTQPPYNSQKALNDVDDYNYYIRIAKIRTTAGSITQTLTNDTLKVRVYYVQQNNIDAHVPGNWPKSYLKRIDVTVTDSKGYLPTNGLTFSTIKAFGF